MKKLFVADFPFSFGERELRRFFEPYGVVQEVKIVNDREIGVSRGFGFVLFAAAKDAERARDGLNGMDVNGRKLRVEHAFERGAKR